MEQVSDNLTLAELREICRKLRLPVAGLKIDVCRRIRDFLDEIPENLKKSSRIKNHEKLKQQCVAIISSYTQTSQTPSSSPSVSVCDSELESTTTTTVIVSNGSRSWCRCLKSAVGYLCRYLPSVIGICSTVYTLYTIYSVDQSTPKCYIM